MVARSPATGWFCVRDHARAELLRGGATDDVATQLASVLVPDSLTPALRRGSAFVDLARRCAADPAGLEPIAGPEFLSPVDPPLFRDFMVFEDHFSFGYRWRDMPVPDVLYELPVSYGGNPATIIGPGDTVPWPHYAGELDYELELGIVLAAPAADLAPEEAASRVLGLTLLNDFSARDIQRREMAAGLGPAKGKNFGTAVGPWIATMDELGEGPDLELSVLVNGELRGTGRSSEMIWSVAEIVAWASAGETVPAGSLLGTGTVNGCSGLEAGRLLEAGDVVELSGDPLGRLRTTVGTRRTGWEPEPRRG